jgi:hypothetical protein
MKTVLITFIDMKSILHFVFIPQGQTVSQAYYVEILKQLRGCVYRKRPGLWPNYWIPHDGTAPAHKMFSDEQFLA